MSDVSEAAVQIVEGIVADVQRIQIESDAVAGEHSFPVLAWAADIDRLLEAERSVIGKHLDAVAGQLEEMGTQLRSVRLEHDALKAVEAAAREIETITQGYIDGYRSGQPFVIEGKQTEARERLQAALAALDAIRTPDDGKRGGARL